MVVYSEPQLRIKVANITMGQSVLTPTQQISPLGIKVVDTINERSVFTPTSQISPLGITVGYSKQIKYLFLITKKKIITRAVICKQTV